MISDNGRIYDRNGDGDIDITRQHIEKFGDKLAENWEKPLELIFQNRHVSAATIADKIGISSRAVQKQLAKMKEIGILERVGRIGEGIE